MEQLQYPANQVIGQDPESHIEVGLEDHYFINLRIQMIVSSKPPEGFSSKPSKTFSSNLGLRSLRLKRNKYLSTEDYSEDYFGLRLVEKGEGYLDRKAPLYAHVLFEVPLFVALRFGGHFGVKPLAHTLI
ncbi:hypothetical protein GUJ93_ZPchr0006g45318 [Zizania palustris]|uniref:Uncharacterized protein n=1 Tax=Zizania palustris TaxID=103762 RepID=A0A8J5SMU3_ZIZPA|nr:hypothetical protein GUJ93_ZPchr0006g45318 [Zizania palustris]